MVRSLSMGLLAPCLLLVAALPAAAQGKLGELAQDFPPGAFSDGRSHQLKDFTGKLVVLYFFETTNPFCRGSVVEHNALVKAMKDKPVKFLAIAANVTSGVASGYARQTGLAMPVYADNLGLMQKRYGMEISLKNIYQFRVIAPDGKVICYQATKEELNNFLDKTQPKWKYREAESDPKLMPALEELEGGQYAPGMKLLAAWRKSTNKRAAAQAGKLFDALKKEGAEWKTEAEQLVETDPVRAYDLYNRVATLFVGDELAKSAAGPLKKLRASKAVAAELAARKAYTQLLATMGQLTPMQKTTAAKLCRNFSKRYDGTPTAEKADLLASELGN